MLSQPFPRRQAEDRLTSLTNHIWSFGVIWLEGNVVWLLDRFSNPLWYRISKLDKNRRRIVATTLCSGDFLRVQIEKKLVGPAEAYLQESAPAPKFGEHGLSTAFTTRLVDQALLGLLRSCRRPPSDPGRKLPPRLVARLPELWEDFVRADIQHRLSFSVPGDLKGIQYAEDPEEAHAQVLSQWARILGIQDPDFASRLNVSGFTEAWDWFVEMYIADTLEGMAVIPDKILFAQARRLAAATPPHRASLVDRFLQQIRSAPEGRPSQDK